LSGEYDKKVKPLSPAALLVRRALSDPRSLLRKLVIGEAIAERTAVLQGRPKKEKSGE
jgi:hypothetical protein